MFPLAGKTFPQTAAELSSSIQSALADVLTFPGKGSPVTVDAPNYPAVNRLAVDLSGARVTAKTPPPRPQPTGQREPGITVDQLDVTGKPVLYENGKANLEVRGKGLTFQFARDQQGHPLLVLSGANEGSVDVNVTKADLQALALAAANLAAKEHGVKIESVDLDLKSEGDRAVSGDVRVKAKKMMLSGVLRVSGRLAIDEDLKATISDLACSGEGMIGSMVAGVVQPKLKGYNGKQVPLMAFSLGDVALRDLKIDTKDGLHVTARFGKGG